MFRTASLLVLLAAVPAAAHDYWLVPETFTPTPGKPLLVRLYVGEAFKPEQEVGWQPKKTTRLQLSADGHVFLGLDSEKEGLKPAVAFDFPKIGSCVLEMERGWST